MNIFPFLRTNLPNARIKTITRFEKQVEICQVRHHWQHLPEDQFFRFDGFSGNKN